MRRPTLALPVLLAVAVATSGPLGATRSRPATGGTVAAPAMRTVAYAEPVLRLTSPYLHSSSVTELQRLLHVSADGYFGPITSRAVRSFQSGAHLPVTGVVDDRTWATLRIVRLRWSVGSSHEVAIVTASSWSTSYALVRTFTRTSTGWTETFAPVSARIGWNGFGSTKREGDGQSPVGAFSVPLAFGTSANPGTHLTYRRSTPSDFWVDDVHSTLYNTWQRGTWLGGGYASIGGRRTHVEQMYQTGAYQYGAEIGYNLARTAGAGSAIFLHVTTGRSTAGCVAVSRAAVVTFLRWLTPTSVPRFVMGPTSYVYR